MPRTATDPLMLAAEEADAEAAAAEAEALAAQASASAARARARAARLRREAGGSDEYEYAGATSTRAVVPDPLEIPAPSAGKPEPDTEADPHDLHAEADSHVKTDAAAQADAPADVDTNPRAEPGTEPGSDTAVPEVSGAAVAATGTAAAIGGQGRIRQLPSRITAVLAAAARRLRPSRIRRPRLATVGRLLVVVVVLVALAAGTYSIWNHRQLGADAARADEYLNAAREGVVALTTLDSAQAGADVQRILDHSTGAFRTDFQSRAEDFTKVVEQSQVATEGEITAAAVESTTDDSAVVLISAVSRVTNSAGAEQDPRVWRLSVTVSEGDSGSKMSKVEFVP